MEVQDALLGLLKSFDEVCRSQGLAYFASGGTMLGAVRHGGFIPWDDDLDVAMPREDYERLMGGMVLPEGFRARKDDKLLYGVYEDTRTRVSHGEAEWDVDAPYLSMDVFPLDGAPKNGLARKARIASCLFTFVLIKLKRIEYIQKTEGMKNRTSRPKAEKFLIDHGRFFGLFTRRLDENDLVKRFYEKSRR